MMHHQFFKKKGNIATNEQSSFILIPNVCLERKRFNHCLFYLCQIHHRLNELSAQWSCNNSINPQKQWKIGELKWIITWRYMANRVIDNVRFLFGHYAAVPKCRSIASADTFKKVALFYVRRTRFPIIQLIQPNWVEMSHTAIGLLLEDFEHKILIVIFYEFAIMKSLVLLIFFCNL